jgi:tRNA(Ile2) C34 agmatinyltransferase TiaS
MSIMDTAKDVLELVKKGATIELQERLMQLREEALVLQEENIKLKETVQALEKEREIEQELVYEQPYYWRVKDDQKEGPYCQKCYDSDKHLIRLQAQGQGEWICKACGGHYTDSSYRDDGPHHIKPQGYL